MATCAVRARLQGIVQLFHLFAAGSVRRDSPSPYQPLSPAQLAEVIRIPHRTLSFHERAAGDIPTGLAPLMARALDDSVDELLVETDKKRRAGAELLGGMRRLFEAASKLPRSQQKKIAAVMEAFTKQSSDR